MATRLKTSMILVVGSSLLMAAGQLIAGDVPHQFQSGSPAQASEVNENFQHLDDLVNQVEQDLLDEVDALTTRVDDLDVETVRRRVDIPGNAMGTTGDADDWSSGTRIPASGGSATFSVPRPIDYAGGDVRFILTFQSLFGDPALFAAFTRARSFNHGEPYSDSAGIRFDDVMIDDDQVVYLTSVDVEEAVMSGEVWYGNVQRSTFDEYEGAIIVYSVSMEYDALPQGGQ